MRDPAERDASLALRSARGNRLRKAIGWYRNHDRLHTGDQVTMAADATNAYITACAEGKDVAILCDTWEIADAINQRLHDHYTHPTAPSVQVACGQRVRTGDLIMSRRNDATLTVEPGAQSGPAQLDQVRNGNRWRVLAVDPTNNRIMAGRLTDDARAIFDGDYLREHITLGYAGTVHSAQGMTIGNHRQPGICWTILSERASRAMAYVGLTRGRDENHLAIYPAATNGADGHRRLPDDGILQLQRGTIGAAAHALHTILTANDDRARTMHSVAARIDRKLLPSVVGASLDRNDQRCTERTKAWSQRSAQARARDVVYQRLAAATRQTVRRQRNRSRRREQGYGLEI